MIRRILLIVSICIAAVLLLYGLLIAYFYLIAPLTTGFQAYTPTTLPTGVHVTGHLSQQYVYYGDRTVNIAFNVPAFYISENKASAAERANAYTCDNHVLNETCVTMTSPKGQKYQLVTARDEKGTVLFDTISWVKKDTLIAISIEDSAASYYIDAHWGNIIDGFTPANYGYGRGSVVQRSYD